MPVHLPAQNRRQFLFTLGAGFVTCSTGLLAADQNTQQSDIVYLLNDTHIGEKHPPSLPSPRISGRSSLNWWNCRKNRPAS